MKLTYLLAWLYVVGFLVFTVLEIPGVTNGLFKMHVFLLAYPVEWLCILLFVFCAGHVSGFNGVKVQLKGKGSL